MSEFTVYIDESGEAGLEKIRSEESGGASPYMTLGAALIASKHIEETRVVLSELSARIGKKWIHCNQLNHSQKVFVCQAVSELPITLFGVVSHKRTLGWYGELIDRDSKRYYNKCAQYLLECIGDYIGSIGKYSHQLDIIFEEGNFDYEQLANLIRLCQDTPKASTQLQLNRLKLLHNISADRIVAKPKREEPLLQLADVVAHSIYKAVDRHPMHYDVLEPRYLYELIPNFFRCEETSNIVGKGLRPIHSVNHFRRDPEVYANLKGCDPTPTPQPTNSPPHS